MMMNDQIISNENELYSCYTYWATEILSINYTKWPSLTLKFRSKSNINIFLITLGINLYDFLDPVNTNFCSKTNTCSKEVIEPWSCDFSYIQNLRIIIGKISVTGNYLEPTKKGSPRDYETAKFVHLLHFQIQRRFLKINPFLCFFHLKTLWKIFCKQAHKVCVGQNELVMSLLEDFGVNLT
jgi:hypothetical protein